MKEIKTPVSKILDEQTLNTLAEYVAAHGEPEGYDNDYDHNSGDYNSYLYKKEGKIKSLKLDDLELRVTNYHKLDRSSDSMITQWFEGNERVLKISKKDRILVKAYQFLGGKSGFKGCGFRRSETQLNSKPWEIKTVKYANWIPKIITKINEAYS